jgi:hypothetical protein
MRREMRPTAQAGVAAILLLVILVMGSLYALLSSINTATADLEQKRDDATVAALKQAKEALIAWSATHANGPGHLLCPDNNNDGIANTISCGNANTRIGRLPWSTLGLPDLRDASGRRLWYAVSRCFLELSADASCGTYALNSDTQGQLAVTGLMQASGVVAIIFAPGPALSGQNRADEAIVCGTAPQNCQAANFLEGENANAPTTAFENMATSTDLFELRRRCEQAICPGGPFNDQLIVITHAELFDVVENAVAKRIEKEVAPKVLEYSTKWGVYPFAAPFDDQTVDLLYPAMPTDPGRPQAMYYGRDTHTNGLLPVAYDVGWTKTVSTGWVGWQSAGFSVTKLFGLGDIVSGPSCSWVFIQDNGPPGPDPLDDWRWRCSFTYDGGPITVAARGMLANVARSFALPFESTAGFAATVDLGDGSGPQPATILGLTNSLQASGHAQVSFSLRKAPAPNLPAPVVGPATVTFTFAPPRFSELVDPASSSLGWFVRNNWHRELYYAVTDGCRLGGGGCTAGVTVQGSGGPSPGRSVLVLAGRNLAGGPRAWTIANYFEGQNATGSPFFDTPAPDFTFQRGLRSRTFNDKVVVVAP